MSYKTFAFKMFIKSDFYNAIVILPMVSYFASIAGNLEGEKLKILLTWIIINASAAVLISWIPRYRRLVSLLKSLEGEDSNLTEVKRNSSPYRHSQVLSMLSDGLWGS